MQFRYDISTPYTGTVHSYSFVYIGAIFAESFYRVLDSLRTLENVESHFHVGYFTAFNGNTGQVGNPVARHENGTGREAFPARKSGTGRKRDR